MKLLIFLFIASVMFGQGCNEITKKSPSTTEPKTIPHMEDADTKPCGWSLDPSLVLLLSEDPSPHIIPDSVNKAAYPSLVMPRDCYHPTVRDYQKHHKFKSKKNIGAIDWDEKVKFTPSTFLTFHSGAKSVFSITWKNGIVDIEHGDSTEITEAAETFFAFLEDYISEEYDIIEKNKIDTIDWDAVIDEAFNNKPQVKKFLYSEPNWVIATLINDTTLSVSDEIKELWWAGKKLITVDDLQEYAEECYADSSKSHLGYPLWSDGCLVKKGNLADWFELDCNKENHYEYVHRTPTFTGFIKWLEE